MPRGCRAGKNKCVHSPGPALAAMSGQFDAWNNWQQQRQQPHAPGPVGGGAIRDPQGVWFEDENEEEFKQVMAKRIRAMCRH
eukprot:1091940-Amphidinium_carterae.1